MLDTYVPTEESGHRYFTGMSNLFSAPVHSDAITTPSLILSDRILIDSSWQDAYETNDAIFRVIKHLVDRRVVVEVSPDEALPREESLPFIATGLWAFLVSYADYYDHRLEDDFQELILSAPLDALERLRDHNEIPGLENLRDSGGLTIILDSIFTAFVAGNLCSRLYDPRGYLRIFRNVTVSAQRGEQQTSASDPVAPDEWLLQLTKRQLPKTHILVTKEGYPARFVHPIERFGFHPEKRSHKGKPDVSRTLENLEKIVAFRDSSVCTDLRGAYSDLIARVAKGQVGEIEMPVGKDLDKQWHHAQVEFKRSLSAAERTESWTDILTIPAAVAGAFLPIVGLVPLITWISEKILRRHARQKIARAYPWFFVMEQFKDLEQEFREQIATRNRIGRQDKQ